MDLSYFPQFNCEGIKQYIYIYIFVYVYIHIYIFDRWLYSGIVVSLLVSDPMHQVHSALQGQSFQKQAKKDVCVYFCFNLQLSVTGGVSVRHNKQTIMWLWTLNVCTQRKTFDANGEVMAINWVRSRQHETTCPMNRYIFLEHSLVSVNLFWGGWKRGPNDIHGLLYMVHTSIYFPIL